MPRKKKKLPRLERELGDNEKLEFVGDKLIKTSTIKESKYSQCLGIAKGENEIARYKEYLSKKA